jgi:hypothetical protein
MGKCVPNGGGEAFCGLKGKHTPVFPFAHDEGAIILAALNGKKAEVIPSEP